MADKNSTPEPKEHNYRVTFTPAKGAYTGREITRTFVAVSEFEAKESCFRVFPGSVVSNVTKSKQVK